MYNIIDENNIRAILGPTNTGKTWLALDRMFSYSSGIIGFPLRLLARENYDRAIKIKNIRDVALITGEEKIIPPHAKYFLCTTESMPMGLEVDFMAVDEIQLCSDPDRGHIFTERLLYARGRFETMFMGAEIIAPFIRKLVPKAQIETRARLSILSYAGRKSIDKMPPRTAIVSFSANDVYALAELVRRQRGGAAIVLGALSPRTRNAQVEMYQAGEVDWLVATDAIGMGLNMDINHVAFAATKKFDGRNLRSLNAQELAQIAGRAGRGGHDGSFGITGKTPALEVDMIEAIETHEFRAAKHIYWRNHILDFSSLTYLQQSLKQPPPMPNMLRPRYAEDEEILNILSQDTDIKIRLNSPSSIKTLWEACRIPDFSKTHVKAHASMLQPILIDILDKGYIRTSWMEKQFNRLTQQTDDLQKLLQYIASIRTLTYISYQKKWLNHAEAWQAQTRSLEDRLSDRLHESLTKLFVDRKTATLMGKLKQYRHINALVHNNGKVEIEGQDFGYLQGFRFHSHNGKYLNENFSEKAVQSAVNKALNIALNQRIKNFEQASFKDIILRKDKHILWKGHPIAYLIASDQIYKPRIKLLETALLKDNHIKSISNKLDLWLHNQLEHALSPLLHMESYMDYNSPYMRGIAYEIKQNLGSMKKETLPLKVKTNIKNHKNAIFWGHNFIYFPILLKQSSLFWRKILCEIHYKIELIDIPPNTRFIENNKNNEYALKLGYFPVKKYWIRIDIIEKLIAKAKSKTNLSPQEASNLLGIPLSQLPSLLKYLGFMKNKNKSSQNFYWRGYILTETSLKKYKSKADSHSPFAVLENLQLKSDKTV